MQPKICDFYSTKSMVSNQIIFLPFKLRKRQSGYVGEKYKHYTLIEPSLEAVAILLLSSPRKRQCVTPCEPGVVAGDDADWWCCHPHCNSWPLSNHNYSYFTNVNDTTTLIVVHLNTRGHITWYNHTLIMWYITTLHSGHVTLTISNEPTMTSIPYLIWWSHW